jgi:hypothetical protein
VVLVPILVERVLRRVERGRRARRDVERLAERLARGVDELRLDAAERDEDDMGGTLERADLGPQVHRLGRGAG